MLSLVHPPLRPESDVDIDFEGGGDTFPNDLIVDYDAEIAIILT